MSKEINNKRGENLMYFETLRVQKERAVLFVEINAPPMNLMGPQLVSNLVDLIQRTEGDDSTQVLVFTSADPDYFISHVDVTRIKENREAATKLNGEASIGQLLHYLSSSRLITIAQIEGRVRGIGSEFVLACDMRFASLESAIFNQFEPSFGVIPGAGAVQHLARLLGRGRALEVMLSAQDYSAELAERYGWINRALPANELSYFVSSLAHRIANFPANGRAVVKERVNAITLPSTAEIRRDGELFIEGVSSREFQELTKVAIERGFQTPKGELDLAGMLGDLAVTLTDDQNGNNPHA